VKPFYGSDGKNLAKSRRFAVETLDKPSGADQLSPGFERRKQWSAHRSGRPAESRRRFRENANEVFLLSKAMRCRIRARRLVKGSFLQGFSFILPRTRFTDSREEPEYELQSLKKAIEKIQADIRALSDIISWVHGRSLIMDAERRGTVLIGTPYDVGKADIEQAIRR
jgi:hypothetical protein